MRSFQQVVIFLFALLVAAFASEIDSYDSTIYITSTIYRVNTVTMSGTPTAPVVNMTSTISASHAPTYPAMSSIKPNGTSIIAPSGSGSGVKPSQPQFTGAASAMNIPAYLAVLAAGAGYLVL